MWSPGRFVRVGGLTCVGFGEADGRELLLVVSHDGRGVFELDLTRVARDRGPIEDSWHDDKRHTAIGIGPLDGVEVPVAGLWGGALPARTSDGWEVELLGGERVVLRAPDGQERVVAEETVWEVRAVGFSPRGAALVVATTGDVTVFLREPAR
jgi:hypothetical protein